MELFWDRYFRMQILAKKVDFNSILILQYKVNRHNGYGVLLLNTLRYNFEERQFW